MILSSGVRTSFVFLLGALTVAGPLRVSAQAPGSAGTDSLAVLRGVVLQPGQAGPLPEAEVRLSAVDFELRRVTTADGAGRFHFDSLPPGPYHMQVEHLGYKPLVRELALSEGSGLDVRVRMALEVLPMEPIMVVTEALSHLERVGFYERSARGSGHFFTRAEIEERGVARISDLLAPIPGLQVLRGRGGRVGGLRGRRGCEPTFYLNGGRMLTTANLDEFLAPGDIAGLEVYPRAVGPPGYPGDGCGTLLVWTEAETVEDGSPGGLFSMGWKKLLLPLAVLTWMGFQIF